MEIEEAFFHVGRKLNIFLESKLGRDYEEDYDSYDKVLPEVFITSQSPDPLYIYPNLFAVCNRSVGKVWSFERLLTCYMEDIALQSIFKRGVRPCSVGSLRRKTSGFFIINTK